MQARNTGLGTLLGVIAAGPLSAQVTFRSAGRELADAGSDIIYTWTAPLRADRRDWLSAAAFGAGFALLLPLDDDVDRWVRDHQGSELLGVVKPFRRTSVEGSRLATDRRLVPISGALLLAGLVTDNRRLRDAGYGCASSWAVSTTLRSVMYAGVARTRPLVGNGDQFDIEFPGGDYNVHSFFSGHSMNAFACAAYMNTRFDLGVGEPLLYAVAAAISGARMADRFHWTSDVYLGSVAGVAVGRTIARRSLRREVLRAQGAAGASGGESWLSGFRASPTPGGVAISWGRSF